ncbi:VacJ family lipoprotein [Thiomicrorhabdus sp.]|uniref:MlaA family lipoprotein n=1 Tax=Thiomicrorhabdus sp. TaxID=2039724 RepID=UPI002AA7891B|nr:VacJ family lipoprotein [Thiomicrorhabdus sp.]
MKKILLLSVVLSGSLFSLNCFADIDEAKPKPAKQMPPMSSEDPYESFNRVMFDFNMGFNDTVGRPVANAYNGVVPQPVRTGVSNVFNNLSTPLSAINCFLQGKVEDGLSEIMRFTLNSTFGLLGLLDIAEPAGLPPKNEDLGQTLYKWGVWNESNYLVLPLFGPYTTRSLTGNIIDSGYDPVYKYIIDIENDERVLIYFGDEFVSYTSIVKLLEDIKNQPDPYVFSRESYLQYRTNLIYDGNPPQPDLDDFDFN